MRLSRPIYFAGTFKNANAGGRVESQPETEAERHREHPLSNGHAGHDVIAQMRRKVGHSAPEAGRTETATLARERDEPASTATVADNAEKPMGRDAALEECLDFVDHESW